MADENLFDPRRYWGFTGRPLPTKQGSTLPDSVRQRFEEAGQGAFVDFIDPYATLAQAEGYRQADRDLQIADDEAAFMDALPSLSGPDATQNQAGFRQFLQQHPGAIYSPMAQIYQRFNPAPKQVKDPFEPKVAAGGSAALDQYRNRLAKGTDPMDAYAHFRDSAQAAKDANKTTTDDELFFVQQGGDLSDFPALKGQGASRAQMLDFINKKGRPLTSTESTKLVELQQEANDAENAFQMDMAREDGKSHEASKREVFKAKFGREPESEEDWTTAYGILFDKTVGTKQLAYDSYVKMLEEQGKRVKKATPPAPAAKPTPPAPPARSPYDGGTAAAYEEAGKESEKKGEARPREDGDGSIGIRAENTPPAPMVATKPGLSPLAQIRKALKP